MSRGAPRCRVCGDVIGVYEPLVAVCEGEALETSRAAAMHEQLRGDFYHRACYQARYERPGQGERQGRGERQGDAGAPREQVEGQVGQTEGAD